MHWLKWGGYQSNLPKKINVNPLKLHEESACPSHPGGNTQYNVGCCFMSHEILFFFSARGATETSCKCKKLRAKKQLKLGCMFAIQTLSLLGDTLYLESVSFVLIKLKRNG